MSGGNHEIPLAGREYGRPEHRETRRLATHISRLSFDDLPGEVVHRAKQVVADSLACAIAGLALAPEVAAPQRRFALAIGGPPEASIIGGGMAAQPLAAMANATMVHTIDFDDTHLPSIAHFGAPVTASALAAVEALGLGGRELLTAVVAGFEAGGRVGRSVLPGHYQRWHSTSSLGGIAAAAAAARAMSLDPEGADMAISLAADDAGGTRYCLKVGDFTKSLHAGTAAWKGSQAALLATLGVHGPTGLLEHPVGFFWAYSDEGEPGRLQPNLESVGTTWEILEDDLKAYPSIHASHTGVEATIELTRDNAIAPHEIAGIHITHPFFSANHALNYEPDSVMAARLSIPFCIAVAAIDGSFGLRSFEGERYLDPAVRGLMRKVRTTADSDLNRRYPDTTMSVVEIETLEHGTFETTIIYPIGSHKRPFSDAEHGEKVAELLSLSLDDGASLEVVEALAELDSAESLDSLTEPLRRAKDPSPGL